MIRWPERFDPRTAPVHVRNEIRTAASPAAAWAWLVRAEAWPRWYPNAKNVRIVEGPRPDLALGSRFLWRTFGVAVDSRVEEYVAGERIAWIAHGIGFEAYHAWLVEPAEGGGCRVVTEETQHGWMARLGAALLPRRMHHWHQVWLERLDEAATRSPSPPPAPAA